MKITVNFTRHTTLNLLAISGLGLSACVPIPQPQIQPQMPQAYPMQPQAQGQYRQQPAAHIPRAAALPTHRGAVQQGRTVAAVPVNNGQQRPVQRQVVVPSAQVRAPARTVQAQVAVPPVLKPAQQQAQRYAINQQSNVNSGTRYRRPSASVSQPPEIVYREEKKTRPVVSAGKAQPASQPARKATTAARRPVQLTRPSASVRKTPPPPPVATVTVKKESTQVQSRAKEVLDMSKKVQEKPTASTQLAKKAAPLPPAKSYSNSPAVSILVKQANNELSVGKTGRAAATLERALRIAPDDPVLWLRLAEVNEQQGNKTQAASMARKAIGLAPGDENLKQRGQRLLN